MANVKKYLLTGIILGSIAAISAGLISLTNLVSEKKIIENEQNAINLGIKKIFDYSAKYINEDDVSNHKYTVHYYEVKNDNEEFLGYAFRCEGSNMYGKISLIAGFDAISHNFKSIYLIKNEQTYASTLVENYVNPLNNEEKKLDEVNCGATYGAKLIRDMVNDASEAANEFWK